MTVEVRTATEADRTEIENLLDRYLIELSQHRENPVGAARASEYPYLKYYWTDRDRFPFTVWLNNELAGFALVRRTVEPDGVTFQVAEFFIEPEHRRSGVGSTAIASIWNRFAGRWELQVMKSNKSGMRFWEQCINTHAKTWDVEQIVAADGRRYFFHFEIPDNEAE